jgi:hypothetical protein
VIATQRLSGWRVRVGRRFGQHPTVLTWRSSIGFLSNSLPAAGKIVSAK